MNQFFRTATAVVIPLAVAIAAPNIANANDNGIKRLQSPHTVAETADRFESAVREKGMKVFSRYDHAAAATEFGQVLPPLVTLAFGNPKYGSPFMATQPEAGIDFPPKVVVYEDNDGTVWLSYNTADYLYNTIFVRHGLHFSAEEVRGFESALNELITKTIAP